MFKNRIHACFNPLPLYLKTSMDKTSQKITKDKDPNRVDAGRKGRENFIKKMKENNLNDAKKGG